MAEARFTQPRNRSGMGNPGWFASFEKEVEDIVHREALQFQADVSQYIKSHIGYGSREWADQRKRETTGRLARVTTSAGNRDVKKSLWYVGDKTFLNNSEAKYARTIEFGSKAVWSHNFIGTPLMRRFGGFPGGRDFRSLKKGSKFRGSYGIYGAADANGRGGGFDIVRVKHEIQPMRAYSTVWKDGGWAQRVKRDFGQVMKKL
jgi:hypothetical protein